MSVFLCLYVRMAGAVNRFCNRKTPANL
jgi:ribosomal protein L24E